MQEIKARLEIESILFHYTSSIDSGVVPSIERLRPNSAKLGRELDNGNANLRAAQNEISQYTMSWNRYVTNYYQKDE